MLDAPQNDLKEKLLKLHHEGEERAAQRLAEKLGLSYVDLGKVPVSLDAVRIISEAEAKGAKVAAIEVKSEKIALAAIDPELPATKKIVEELGAKKYEVKIVVVSPSSMDAAWKFYQFVKPEAETITGKVEIAPERLVALRAKLTTIDAVHAEVAALPLANVSPVALIEVILAGAMGLRRTFTRKRVRKKQRFVSASTGCFTIFLATFRWRPTTHSCRASSCFLR
jgi:hypothetical protein